MSFAAGTMVNPRVRLLRLLGRGAMGSVWIGEHLTLETEVAVKFIKPELSAEAPETLLQRFEREAKAAAKIKSPHVVQTFDQGTMQDGTPYIVMELLEGETLGERLARTGRVSLREAEQIVTQVCRGLSKAHELGIIHRDIKPDNLFLVGSGEELLVKILDFGIAKQVQMPAGAATASGTLVGTPQYMSPEQLLRAEAVDIHVDLWALAVVTYLAILGRPPFEGETLAGIIVAITHGKFARPSSIDDRLTGPIDQWFDRAMSLEPQARYASAKDLGSAFRAAVAQVPGEHPSGLGAAVAPSASPPEGVSSDSEPSELAETAAFIAEQMLDVDSEGGPLGAPGTERAENREAAGQPAAEQDDERAAPLGAVADSAVKGRAGVDAGTPAAVKVPTMHSEIEAPAAAGRSRRRSVAAVGVVLLTLVAIGLWVSRPDRDEASTAPSREPGPTSSGASGAARSGVPPVATTASAAVTGVALAEAGAMARTGPLGPLSVKAGRTPDGDIWLPAYRLVRQEDDENASYLEAQAACRMRAMTLCTEAQWQRACAQDPAVGAMATWTATAVTDRGFVARGGDGTCGLRQVLAPAERSPTRGGVCCGRAVGIRSANTNVAFITTTATKLARIEQAFATGNVDLLSSLVGDTVRYRGSVLSRQAFLERASKMFRQQPDGWILHDVCNVALFEEDGEHAWSADCSCVVQAGRRLGHWVRRYVHDGRSGKLRNVDVPKVHRELSPP